MKRKTKALIRLLLFIGLLLSLVTGFFLWQESKQLPLAVGDQLILAQGQPGDLVTIGITLYNNGERPIKLQSVQVAGSSWDLSSARMTTAPLTYAKQPLETWAAANHTVLAPVNGFRIAKHRSATLGISLKRTANSSTHDNSLIVTYRLLFFTRQLRIELQR
ncbi:MAG: hypothetical protein ACM3ZQ_05745 [Bacillota bacterium]